MFKDLHSVDSANRAQYERYINGFVDHEPRTSRGADQLQNHDTMSSDDASRFKINEGICRPIRKYGGSGRHQEDIAPQPMVTINVSSIKPANKKLATNCLNGHMATQENSDSFNNHSSVQDVDMMIAEENQCFAIKSNVPEVMECNPSAETSTHAYRSTYGNRIQFRLDK